MKQTDEQAIHDMWGSLGEWQVSVLGLPTECFRRQARHLVSCEVTVVVIFICNKVSHSSPSHHCMPYEVTITFIIMVPNCMLACHVLWYSNAEWWSQLVPYSTSVANIIVCRKTASCMIMYIAAHDQWLSANCMHWTKTKLMDIRLFRNFYAEFVHKFMTHRDARK